MNTRRSSERLLQTWKNGMPNGTPVFSRHLIESMERSIQYIQQNQYPGQKLTQPHPHPHPQQPMSNPPVHINPHFAAKVIYFIRVIIVIFSIFISIKKNSNLITFSFTFFSFSFFFFSFFFSLI